MTVFGESGVEATAPPRAELDPARGDVSVLEGGAEVTMEVAVEGDELAGFELLGTELAFDERGALGGTDEAALLDGMLDEILVEAVLVDGATVEAVVLDEALVATVESSGLTPRPELVDPGPEFEPFSARAGPPTATATATATATVAAQATKARR